MENCQSIQIRQPAENLFLIDWITVVFKSKTVTDVQSFLSMKEAQWVTEKKFRNGYPMTTEFSNISIWWGADKEEYYDSFVKKDGTYSLAADKVRMDMGVCLNMSGQGCRSFEEFSVKTWFELICDLQVMLSTGECSITRLDLAYDDHVGLLPLWKIHNDVKDRNFRGAAKKTRIIWSDDMEMDLQGLTIEIGSKKSEIMIRIYDKAAERGYEKHKHWVRLEIQLRRERAEATIHCLAKDTSSDVDVGHCASGILRNYCLFVTPSGDTNKSRWPIAEYWARILQDTERIRLWKSPGEPYNFSRAENHMIDQYAQWLCAFSMMHGHSLSNLLDRCREFMIGKKFKPKYKKAISDYLAYEALRKLRLKEEAEYFEFPLLPQDGTFDQLAFSDLFLPDEPTPWD